MTVNGAILFAANLSLAMTMLCAGMGGITGNRTFLTCRRELLVRGALATSILLPAFTVWLCYAFDLRPAVQVALLTMAVSPMPPILPSGLMRVRGNRAFEIALAFVVATLSVVLAPASLWMSSSFFGVPPRVDIMMLMRLVALNVLLPLAVGFGVRRLSLETSMRAVAPLTLGALGTLALALLALLVESRQGFGALAGTRTVMAIVTMVVVALGIGHVCGGPARKNRRVLAMATATRHPALAMAMATTAFPHERIAGVAIVLVVLVAGVAAIAYLPLSRFKLPRI
jgi:BASS family bile acid:Na+ symporter